MSVSDTLSLLSKPLDLPFGVTLKNRLVKSAMSDSLGDGAGTPAEAQIRLYERWAEGGTALTVIGEVQINSHYPEKPGNLVFSSGAPLPSLQELARRGSKNETHIWPQLGHAGALAHRPISTPRGPSPLDIEDFRCDGMSVSEIQALPDSYACAAKISQDAGFGGVLVHAGHGFLLSQFLSPLFNHRTDSYGGSLENRFRIIREIVGKIRCTVGPHYPIGIRINASDNLVGGLTGEDALKIVTLVQRTSVDLIDLSGGTYFPGAASSSDDSSSQGPYFSAIAKQAQALSSIPILLAGGFQTKSQAVESLQDGSADAISLARAMILNPALANDWLSEIGGDPNFPRFDNPPSGGITAWYSMLMTALAEDREARFRLTPAEALLAYELRDARRCEIWRNRFASSRE